MTTQILNHCIKLLFMNVYPKTKNPIHTLIAFWDIRASRILWSDWLTAFRGCPDSPDQTSPQIILKLARVSTYMLKINFIPNLYSKDILKYPAIWLVENVFDYNLRTRFFFLTCSFLRIIKRTKVHHLKLKKKHQWTWFLTKTKKLYFEEFLDSPPWKTRCQDALPSCTISKVFERCLNKQVSPYFDNILSKNKWFRKNYSVKHCLFALPEK